MTKKIFTFPVARARQVSGGVEVHEIQFHLVPQETKDDILHCVFSLLATLDEAESLKDIAGELGQLSKAFSPCYSDCYTVKKIVEF